MRKSLFVFVLAVLAASMAFSAIAPGGGSGTSYPVSCSISPPSFSAKAGTTAPLSVSCSDMGGNAVDCPPMQWSATIGGFPPAPSTAPAIVPHTLQTNEFSAGTATGTGTITAQAPPLSQPTFSCQSSVAVTAGDAAKVAVSPTPVTLSVGSTQQFSAQAFDSYGNQIFFPGAAPQFTWSATGGIGKVDSATGLFSAATAGKGQVAALYSGTPSMQGIRGYADVIVVSSPSTKYCTLDPATANVMVGQKQAFTATCYSDDPRKMGAINTEIPCPSILWAATSGTITPSGKLPSAIFAADKAPGTVTITAYEDTPLASPMAGMTCTATAQVVPGAPASVSISPSSASLYVGDTQQFSSTAADQYGNIVTGAQFNWGAYGGIGTMDGNGQFIANAAGTGTVRADVDCPLASPNGCPHDIADVSVSAAPSGSGGSGGTGGNGNSGTNTGGSSFTSSSTVSYTCAGKPGTLTVQIYQPGATALAEVYYMEGLSHPKVLSVNAANNQQIAFTPDKPGKYELRVTVGTDQRNADFAVMACSPMNENTQNNVSIQLQQKQAAAPSPKPSTQITPATNAAAAPSAQQGGIPVYIIVAGAALVLAAAYFLLFGQKKK